MIRLRPCRRDTAHLRDIGVIVVSSMPGSNFHHLNCRYANKPLRFVQRARYPSVSLSGDPFPRRCQLLRDDQMRTGCWVRKMAVTFFRRASLSVGFTTPTFVRFAGVFGDQNSS